MPTKPTNWCKNSMPRPANLKTKIFLDGADPRETKEVLDVLGFLDGQTTNPTLVTKNPDARSRLERGEKFTQDELWAFYKDTVQAISKLIPHGSVSAEVYANPKTTSDGMIKQARTIFSWIPNAHIKFPTTHEGLKAAVRALQEGMRVNMTLVFSQLQAAAVYVATKGASKGDVFLSPFVGRIDDRGENGMRLVKNIIRMYANGDGHVEVLTASVRNIDHLLSAFEVESDIVTAPGPVLKKWGGEKTPTRDGKYRYESMHELKDILYENISLDLPWEQYDIYHELTDKGIERFSADWNALLQ